MNQQHVTFLRLTLHCSLQHERRRIDVPWFAVSFLRRSEINQPNWRMISVFLENDSFLQAVIFIIDILGSLLCLLSFFLSCGWFRHNIQSSSKGNVIVTVSVTSPLVFKEFSVNIILCFSNKLLFRASQIPYLLLTIQCFLVCCVFCLKLHIYEEHWIEPDCVCYSKVL